MPESMLFGNSNAKQTKKQAEKETSMKSLPPRKEQPVQAKQQAPPSKPAVPSTRQRHQRDASRTRRKLHELDARMGLDKKRKADRDLAGRPSQRQRREAEPRGPEFDQPELLPTTEEYPQLPSHLFSRPKEALHNATQGAVSYETTFDSLKANRWNCSLLCTPSSQEAVTATGHGSDKKGAEKSAYLYLLVALHDNGLLKEFFPPKPTKIDKQTLHDESDAKVDIYNYCARYDATPRITVRESRKLHKRSKRVIDVTVEFPQQGIKVTGRGPDLKYAEVAAAISFKQAVEKYHVEQGTDALHIKDANVMTTASVKNFIEYYKISNPAARFDVTFENLTKFRLWGATPREAQVTLNGAPIGEKVAMISKKHAEDVAYLTAAMALKKANPGVFDDFATAKRSSSGEILRPVPPIDLSIDQDCLLYMRETLIGARKAGLPDEVKELAEEEGSEVRASRFRNELTPSQALMRKSKLEASFKAYHTRPDLAELRAKRQDLPMSQYRAKVIDIVENNVYSIVIGATGSGKTTQVPQILLDKAIQDGNGAFCNIICTQPRRIAATSVAKRVAVERGEAMRDSVGYHVRFDVKLPSHGGSITYCTTGILLQQLQHMPDDVLSNISHLVIDEVHERDMQIDFLLIILKSVMAKRIKDGKSVPKVVLMSATIDADLFSSYLTGADGNASKQCPTLSVPGRTFPVTENYHANIMQLLQKKYRTDELGVMYNDKFTREFQDVEAQFTKKNPIAAVDTPRIDEAAPESIINWKQEVRRVSDGEVSALTEREDALVPFGLAATTIAHIAQTTDDGAILVFLPGLDDILKVNEALMKSPLRVNFQDESKFKLYMLHSSLREGQQEVFNPTPPGCRKIILATNIAETSITIPDVKYVVDTGKCREKQYDQVRRITKLQCTWISKSNSKQRAGRAGRVQNGHYYALFSRERFESMRAIGLPEILRSDLQETCLAIRAQAFKSPIRAFLAQAIEPPAPVAVDASVLNLQALGALTEAEGITALGRVLASLPVHPSLGKMIVLGVVFRCLDPMILLGAAAEERPLFVNPIEDRQSAQAAKMSFVQGTGSDHIALLNAIRETRYIRNQDGDAAMYSFARSNFIHVGAFRAIDNTARQIEEVLVEAGLIPSTPPAQRRNFQYGDPRLNQNSDSVPIIKALMVSGMFPNIAVNVSRILFRTANERSALIHPSSINAPKEKEDVKRFNSGSVLTFSNLAKSTDGKTLYLRETSETTALMTVLFGGRLSTATNSARIVNMDDWIPFYVKSNDRWSMKTLLEFRKALDRLMTSAFRDLSDKKSFLADDQVRTLFAEGLAEVLKRDVRVGEPTASRGWAAKGIYGSPGKGTATKGWKARGEARPTAPMFDMTGLHDFRRNSRRGSGPRLPERAEY